MAKTANHAWQFRTRFRRGAFGWRSQPAIARIKEAVAEIKKVSKKEPVIAAEGAVLFLERISPAIEQVDSSSGAIGGAVHNAIETLVPIIASAPADAVTRAKWLTRLFAAHEADQIPYIERLTDHWGELCGSAEVASAWADRLIGITRMALSPDPDLRGYYHGASACLSALYRAGRYDELLELLRTERLHWGYQVWAVRALVAQGKRAEALRYAETCRSSSMGNLWIDRECEEILLAAGMADEAYKRYGLRANQAGTYLATFRAVARKYPRKKPSEILGDLVATTPGEEGKWFAAAKDAGLYDEALALARRTPCDPRTLARAARDFAEKRPDFAIGAGLASLHWLTQGYGYDITSADVFAAYHATLAAAAHNGTAAEVKDRIRELVAAEPPGGFVSSVLARQL